MTHHLPSFESVNLEKFKGNLLNYSFANTGLDYWIANENIDYWVHGHTHDKVDYNINGTNVLCNPRGNGIEVANFNPFLVFDL